MIELNSPELRFAIKAVRLAALTKGDKSPVTVADFAAQALVAHLLQNTLPDALLVGEESASELRTEEGQTTLKTITKFVQTRIQKSPSQSR